LSDSVQQHNVKVPDQ